MSTTTRSPSSVGVISARPLRAEAVARVLERASVPVLRGEDAHRADVLVLVDPGTGEWRQLQDSDRPAVALLPDLPSGPELLELIEAGADGVLRQACEASQLVDTLARVASGDTGLTGRQSRLLVDTLRARARREPANVAQITGRELEILIAIEAGLSVKQTAQRLQISPRTVENTQRLLFRKLGVRNRAQAVARALQSGLLRPRHGVAAVPSGSDTARGSPELPGDDG